MAKCPVCGFNNMQDRTTCLKCSAALGNRIRIEIGDKPGRRPLRPAWPAKLLRFDFWSPTRRMRISPSTEKM